MLASRDQIVAAQAKAAYPSTCKTLTTAGAGYRAGYDQSNRTGAGDAA